MRLSIFLLLIALNCAPASEADLMSEVSCSIGRVILAADRRDSLSLGDGGGSLLLMKTIREEYSRLARKGKDAKVSFFWAIMLRIELDGGFKLEVVEMIAKDCGPSFKGRLEAFLKKSLEISIDGSQQRIAKSFLAGLNASDLSTP
jgi:hypothetical protein